MQAAIQVERDAAGIGTAVRELFEESFFEEAVRTSLEKVGDDELRREEILNDAPRRTLSPGYYDRAGYALDLGAAIEAGAQYPATMLMRSDVIGLQAVRRAKAEFERDHPGCPRCGVRQDNRFLQTCKKCAFRLAGGND